MTEPEQTFETIRSQDNSLVKSLKKQRRHLRSTGKLFVEGATLVSEALGSQFEFELVAFTDGFRGSDTRGLLARLEELSVRRVCLTASLFESISTVETPQGILAVCARPQPSWESIEHTPSTPIVMASDIQDPGNLGAIARVLESVGGRALISSGGCDPYGPKTLRGSMGSLFRTPALEVTDPLLTVRRLRQAGYQTLAADPGSGLDFREARWNEPCAILLGNEARGLDETLLEAAQQRVKIPMEGRLQSLNVAATAALLLYEWRRNQ